MCCCAVKQPLKQWFSEMPSWFTIMGTWNAGIPTPVSQWGLLAYISHTVNTSKPLWLAHTPELRLLFFSSAASLTTSVWLYLGISVSLSLSVCVCLKKKQLSWRDVESSLCSFTSSHSHLVFFNQSNILFHEARSKGLVCDSLLVWLEFYWRCTSLCLAEMVPRRF